MCRIVTLKDVLTLISTNSDNNDPTVNSTITIGVVSLGCPKNTADTEVMLGLLAEAGFKITFNNDEADLCLVNTCSFIKAARQESVKTLVELASQGKKLIIAGCLAQQFKGELLEELPEAVAAIGTGDIARIAEIVKTLSDNPTEKILAVSSNPSYNQVEPLPRIPTGCGASAYLKIAEGCNHHCTFCIIPALRGTFRSRTTESLVAEARTLVSSGVRELILVSQDSTYYGTDLYGRPALGQLLEALHEIDDLDWIRSMYFYPGETNDDLLTTIARLPKVVKYIDIPLQHSHSEILSAMGRPGHPEKTVASIRKIIPQAAIRSTFIVGFPGETQEQFEHLCRFIEQTKFDRLGVFTYSRENTSGQMPGQLPERTKRQRRAHLMEIQQQISKEHNLSLVGSKIKVLIEGFDEAKKLFFGRSQYDAPEIDNLVYVKPDDNCDIIIGDFAEVVVTKAKPYDLIGQATSD